MEGGRGAAVWPLFLTLAHGDERRLTQVLLNLARRLFERGAREEPGGERVGRVVLQHLSRPGAQSPPSNAL